MSKQYNFKNIRTLLIEGFTNQELYHLCFDVYDFRPVYHQLTETSGKIEIVQKLLEYIEQKELIKTLLDQAKERNPAKYKKYQPYIEDVTLSKRRTGDSPRVKINNPFHYGGPVPPESFVGHRGAVDFCRAKLAARQPASIAISGERRIGKTSLLHYLLHKFSAQEGWGQRLSLFLDCGIFGGSLTSATFWREVLHLLQMTLDPTSSLVNQISALYDQPNLSGQDFRRLLSSYYKLHAGQALILLLDEFELLFQAYNQDIQNLLTSLRAITLAPANKIILITATRDPLSQVCQPFTQETGLNFHGNFVPCQLEPFNEAETHYVVQTLLAETAIEFSPQELNYIWQLSQWPGGGAYPIFVQVAASLIFEYKQNNQAPIDYLYLEHEFEMHTSLYREEIVPAAPKQTSQADRQPGASIDYELALNILEQKLLLDDAGLILEFYALARQLRKNMRAKPQYRLNPTLHYDRQATLEELTRLSLKITGLNFDQLLAQKPSPDVAEGGKNSINSTPTTKRN